MRLWTFIVASALAGKLPDIKKWVTEALDPSCAQGHCSIEDELSSATSPAATILPARVNSTISEIAQYLDTWLPQPPSLPCQFGHTPIRFLSLKSLPDRTANMNYRLRACPQAKVHYGVLAKDINTAYDVLPREVIFNAMNKTDQGEAESVLQSWKKKLCDGKHEALTKAWEKYTGAHHAGLGEHALVMGQMSILREMLASGAEKWVMMEDDATLNLIRLHSHTFGQLTSRDPKFGNPQWGALQLQRSPVVKWQQTVNELGLLREQISSKTSYGAVMMVMSRDEAEKRLAGGALPKEEVEELVKLSKANRGKKEEEKKPLANAITRIGCPKSCVWDMYHFGAKRTTYFPFPDWATQGSSAETAHVRGEKKDFWDRHEWVRLSAVNSARDHFEMMQYLSALISAASSEDFFAAEMLTSLIRTRWSRQQILLELINSMIPADKKKRRLGGVPGNSIQDVVTYFHTTVRLPGLAHNHISKKL